MWAGTSSSRPSTWYQEQALIQLSENGKLDLVASVVSNVLNSKGKPHAFFGGYAVTLLGGDRTTEDVDLIVVEPADSIRQLLLESDPGFFMSSTNELLYRKIDASGQEKHIPVEILQGGEVSILHPSVLLLTKVHRWMFIAESTRPASLAKAGTDFRDIITLLNWMRDHNLTIEFSGFYETRKEKLLAGFQLLLHLNEGLKDVLKQIMFQADFQTILEFKS
ncbi:hypothetical protein EMCG_03622 [[Emmonsia] crescens]|uniref:Uncharacterized protein n=1 Tax=[Emmonsia] crescens TaxID=73230 RepID=A0A0G2HUS4_9EURO|nr:hypothetical protein EMCG_03622 [Emmonsia crescens UAMH 3008]